MVIDIQPLVRTGLPFASLVSRLGLSGVLYITPDQVLPLTSVLGAILGVLLMFWNRVVGLARRAWEFLSRKK